MFKLSVFFCVVLTVAYTNARDRRDLTVRVKGEPNALDSLKRNLENFRKCIDQSLTHAVDDVNEQHLQPVINVIGDQILRVSKAIEDLTGTKRPEIKDPDLEINI